MGKSLCRNALVAGLYAARTLVSASVSGQRQDHHRRRDVRNYTAPCRRFRALTDPSIRIASMSSSLLLRARTHSCPLWGRAITAFQGWCRYRSPRPHKGQLPAPASPGTVSPYKHEALQPYVGT